MEFKLRNKPVVNVNSSFIFILFIFFVIVPFRMFAQGFTLTEKPSEIDSLLQIKTELTTTEANFLFDYLTNFKYYVYDEINEFERARQEERNKKIINSLRDNSWIVKYKINLRRDVLSTTREDHTLFYLYPYDFDDHSFKILFGNIPIEINVDLSGDDKLKISNLLGLPKDKSLRGLIIRLKIIEEQSRTYKLWISESEAESLKRKLEKLNRSLECNIAVEFYPSNKIVFEDRYGDAYIVLKLKYKILYFIIQKDIRDEKILEWRAE